MAVLFLAGTLVLYFAAFAYARAAADSSYDRLLAGSAESIAETLGVSATGIEVDIPYAALDMLSAAPEDRVFYRVFASDSETITGYPDLPETRVVGARDSPSRSQRDFLHSARQFFDADYRGETVRFVQLGRRVAESGNVRAIWVQVGQTRRARQAMTSELVIRAVVPIALLTCLALALIWFGIGRALRPLEVIGSDLIEREPSDLRPITAPVPAEVAPMVDAMNGFMARLSANIDGLRAFVGEAAHQMRTPLAALRAQAQLAVDDDASQMRRSLLSIERNAARLTRLLNQMLSDATVGHRSRERRFKAIDLIDVVREGVHVALPIESRSSTALQFCLDHAPLEGDPLMLAEAVKNLVENAIQHGGGEVEITLCARDPGYLLTVSDRGPGIAPENRGRVFERFVRGASQSPGAGLGLAIVRQAVEGHNGQIRLEDRPGGGLTISIVLPVSGA